MDVSLIKNSVTQNESAYFPRGEVPSNWAKKWTAEEDARLLSGIQEYQSNWKKIAEVVGTRDQG
jgi:hypothetical protein